MKAVTGIGIDLTGILGGRAWRDLL